MEIQKVKLNDLRNEEHFNYHSEVNELITRFTVEALKLQRYYPAYAQALAEENEALNIVRKSTFTGPIAQADHTRDTTTEGLEDMINASLRHFRANVREAARRLKIVFDSFEGLTTKPYDQQTTATLKLIELLETKYAADVATLRLGDWVNELKENNQAVVALVGERYTDESEKSPLKMKPARKALDAAYRNVVKLIDALMFVEGPEAYEAFVVELNQRIEKYNTRLSQRDGRNQKDDEPEED
jgi:hypothetical protein